MKLLRLGISTLVVINFTLWLSTDAAKACSFLNFVHQGKMYIGRTNELPFETDETLIIVPRNYTFHGVKIQHGFVGINHGNDPFVSSGMTSTVYRSKEMRWQILNMLLKEKASTTTSTSVLTF